MNEIETMKQEVQTILSGDTMLVTQKYAQYMSNDFKTLNAIAEYWNNRISNTRSSSLESQISAYFNIILIEDMMLEFNFVTTNTLEQVIYPFGLKYEALSIPSSLLNTNYIVIACMGRMIGNMSGQFCAFDEQHYSMDRTTLTFKSFQYNHQINLFWHRVPLIASMAASLIATAEALENMANSTCDTASRIMRNILASALTKTLDRISAGEAENGGPRPRQKWLTPYWVSQIDKLRVICQSADNPCSEITKLSTQWIVQMQKVFAK